MVGARNKCVCVCVGVCVCVRACVCLGERTQQSRCCAVLLLVVRAACCLLTHTHSQAHARTHTRIHTRTHAHTHASTRIRTLTRTLTDTHTHTHTTSHARTYVHRVQFAGLQLEICGRVLAHLHTAAGFKGAVLWGVQEDLGGGRKAIVSMWAKKIG